MPRDKDATKKDFDIASQSTSTYGVDLPKAKSGEKQGNRIIKKVFVLFMDI